MANREQKGNKEKKKPKQDKNTNKGGTPAPFQTGKGQPLPKKK